MKRKESYYSDLNKSREISRLRSKKHKLNNPEKVRSSALAYYHRNKDKQRKRVNERYATDESFNLKTKIRRRIGMALRRSKEDAKKQHRTIDMLGCSYVFYKRYIESLFEENMTWDGVFNGSIHIDHIKPVSKFDLSDPIQQAACFHYTNTQPLWAPDNMTKRDKYV